MSGFRFQDPLWLLLLAPLLVYGFLTLRHRRASVLFSDVNVLAGIPQTLAGRARQMLPGLRVLGMALLIIALARPERGQEEFRVQTEGIAIEMCLDRSGSMQAMDFRVNGKPVNRLTAVKNVFRDFVIGNGPLHGRPDDLIGLIDFGGVADCKCPLTFDHDALMETLNAVQIPEPIFDLSGDMINQAVLTEDIATAIGDAVILAIDRLKDAPVRSKVIVLLSDGKQTAGVVKPAEAAEVARLYGIRIHTIGVGSKGVAQVPETDASGRTVIREQPVDLDEDTLKMLAQATGGRYFHVPNTDMLKTVYGEIDQLEKTPTMGRRYTRYRELYQYAMLPGIGLILLEILLVCTRLRSLP